MANIEQGGSASASITPSGALVVTTRTPLTALTPTFAIIDITSGLAVASNSLRKGLDLVNISSNTISLGIGTTAVLNSGITLQPGSTYYMSEYDFFTSAVNAIASGAGSNLTIQEYV